MTLALQRQTCRQALGRSNPTYLTCTLCTPFCSCTGLCKLQRAWFGRWTVFQAGRAKRGLARSLATHWALRRRSQVMVFGLVADTPRSNHAED